MTAKEGQAEYTVDIAVIAGLEKRLLSEEAVYAGGNKL